MVTAQLEEPLVKDVVVYESVFSLFILPRPRLFAGRLSMPNYLSESPKWPL